MAAGALMQLSHGQHFDSEGAGSPLHKVRVAKLAIQA